jgi:predicted nuclease with RNAse H fold
LHVVWLDPSGRLSDSDVFDGEDVETLAERCASALAVAVDAPDRPSTGAHADDTQVGKKFRTGRCAEVSLGRQKGHWVPWTTPPEPVPVGWISVGIAVHKTLSEQGQRVIEVYPHAAFRELARSESLPKKTTRAGVSRRVEILRAVGIDDPHLEMWSHDSIDAAVAAYVALQAHTGKAERVTCPEQDHKNDGSAIWLPRA